MAEKKQLAQEMARFSNVISLVIRRCNPFPLSTEQALPPTFVPGPVLSLESLDSVIHDMVPLSFEPHLWVLTCDLNRRG